MGSASAKPRQPSGLGAAGKALWRDLVGRYEFDPAELAVVVAACRQSDDIALLEAQIRKSGASAVGSTGQVRLAQAIPEVRQGRLALAHLLRQLALPVEGAVEGEQGAPATAAQRRAQKAAQTRWNRQKESRHGPAAV